MKMSHTHKFLIKPDEIFAIFQEKEILDYWCYYRSIDTSIIDAWIDCYNTRNDRAIFVENPPWKD